MPYSIPNYDSWQTIPSGASDLRGGIVARLKSDATVVSLVGAKVFPLRVPENTLAPAVVYQVLSNPRAHSLDGPIGLAAATVKLGAVSGSFVETVALARAFRVSLDGFTGTLAGGTRVEETVLESETDVYDPPVDDSDVGSFWTVQTYLFRFKESLT